MSSSQITPARALQLLLAMLLPLPAMASDNWFCAKGKTQPNNNEVRILSSGGTVEADWLAYSAGQWGTNVAETDVDNDGFANPITGPGPGAVYGPQVKGFQRDGSPMPKINFYAYGTLKYGVNVAGGNMDSDPYGEILTGSGPGAIFAPHVRGWNYDAAQISPLPKCSFLAAPTLKYGCTVAAAQLLSDDPEEIMVASGPGSVSSYLKGFDYDPATGTTLITNFGFIGNNQSGYNMAGAELDGDFFDEVLVASGPSPIMSAQVRGWNFDGSAMTAMSKLNFFPYPGNYGCNLGKGELDATAPYEEFVTGPGPDPAVGAEVLSWTFNGFIAPLASGNFLAFSSSYGGVVVSAGSFGY